MTDILMPALSPTMEEGVLAKWLVKVGDTVRSGDVIAEIETDKATMEVEAVDDGQIEALLVPEGAEGVKINTPIARLVGGEPASQPGAPTPDLKETIAEHPSSVPPSEEAPGKRGKGDPIEEHASPTKRAFASPLARRIASQRNIDLLSLKGSGPHGRIIRRDVEGLASEPISAAAAAIVAAAPLPSAEVKSLEQLGIPPGSYDLVPLDGMKKTIARRLTESFRDVPHFPLTIDLEIDTLLAARGKINTMLAKSGVRVSVNDLVIKAAALALKRVPAANASFTPEGIALHHHADIAMAVAIDGGLITPIIRSAESKGLAAIAKETKDLAERARNRKLKPDEYLGGTFSISNLGMFGVKAFASIINQPQGAILSVGVGEKRAVVHGDVLTVATVMTVTLTCDHRVVDGAIGARWLQAFRVLIEDPVTMLA